MYTLEKKKKEDYTIGINLVTFQSAGEPTCCSFIPGWFSVVQLGNTVTSTHRRSQSQQLFGPHREVNIRQQLTNTNDDVDSRRQSLPESCVYILWRIHCVSTSNIYSGLNRNLPPVFLSSVCIHRGFLPWLQMVHMCISSSIWLHPYMLRSNLWEKKVIFNP